MTSLDQSCGEWLSTSVIPMEDQFANSRSLLSFQKSEPTPDSYSPVLNELKGLVTHLQRLELRCHCHEDHLWPGRLVLRGLGEGLPSDCFDTFCPACPTLALVSPSWSKLQGRLQPWLFQPAKEPIPGFSPLHPKPWDPFAAFPPETFDKRRRQCAATTCTEILKVSASLMRRPHVQPLLW